MPIAEDNLVQMKIAHLQMLQSVIARMAGYSASLKNYAVTIGAALIALDNSDFGAVGCLKYATVPFLAFMYLDARYLKLEQEFRAEYDRVRLAAMETIDFQIKPVNCTGWKKAVLSWSIAGFYLPLVALFLIIG